MSDYNYNRFFILIGHLEPDEDKFHYFPLFVKEEEIEMGKIVTNKSDLYASLLNEEKKQILQMPLSNGPYFDSGSSSLGVQGFIPYDERTKFIVFTYKGKTIDEIKVSTTKPEINIITEIPGHLKNNNVDLKWKTHYKGENTLYYMVFYSNDGGKSWSPAGDITQEKQMTIDVSELPGGHDCIFSIQVTDSYNNARSETDSFSVDNIPYELFIQSPLEGENLSSSRSVLFIGQGYDPNTGEDFDKGFVWHSSLDGELGEGSLLQKRLSPGKHKIELQYGKSVVSTNISVNE